MIRPLCIFALAQALVLTAVTAESPQGQTQPKFRAQTIDATIQIGYGLAIADVQGDGKPDILLADKTQIVWYENPAWQKHVIAENLTEKDNVCIAARDIDGDGKCEIAVGAQWDPSDTETSGAVFYLLPPANGDRTQKWEAIPLHHEPTTHRMKWVKRSAGRYDLVVVPLHGRGNKNGQGAGVKILAYQKPENPRDPWPVELIDESMHMTHNFDVVPGEDGSENLILAGKEGYGCYTLNHGRWQLEPKSGLAHLNNPELNGIGEIREGKLPLPFVAAIEPMHGNQVAFYTTTVSQGNVQDTIIQRTVLDDTLIDGHALATADLLKLGRDQIIVGWRANANRMAKVGIKMFIPKDAHGNQWETHVIDDNHMACEDLTVADLNADGKPDMIAAGRRTRNVIIYWNESSAD